MRCEKSALVKLKDGKATFYPYRCKCWKCKNCAPRLRRKVIAFAKAGKPNKFITLTVRPSAFNTPDEAARALVGAWRRCREMLKRYHGHKEIEFLAVFEEHKSGWPHLHILTRSKFIRQRWLSKYMRERIDSPIVDIRKVRRASDAAAYVAKYIAKAPMRFGGCKRYWTSARWMERPAKRVKDPLCRWIVIIDAASWLRRYHSDIAFDYDASSETLALAYRQSLAFRSTWEPPPALPY